MRRVATLKQEDLLVWVQASRPVQSAVVLCLRYPLNGVWQQDGCRQLRVLPGIEVRDTLIQSDKPIHVAGIFADDSGVNYGPDILDACEVLVNLVSVPDDRTIERFLILGGCGQR